MSEPTFEYSTDAQEALDRLEAEANDQLWGRICAVIDLVVDHPDSREARAEELRGREGKAVWKVDVFDGGDDYALLWHYNDAGALVIAWIGLWPPG